MVRSTLRKFRSGTTLVELMVVVSILGVLAMVGPQLFKNITRFTRLNTALLETQRGARDSLSHINRTLRQARASTIVINQEPGQPPYSSLYFDSIDGRKMKYYQENKKLFVVSNGSTATLSGNLRNIVFAHPRTDDFKILAVSVTFEKDTYEGATKALQMAIEKVRIMND